MTRAGLRRVPWLLLLVLAVVLVPSLVEAQVPDSTARADSIARARRDSVARADSVARTDSVARADSIARRDSAARADSIAGRDSLGPGGVLNPLAPGADTLPKELVQWADLDSAMTSLLERQGYHVTKYQGDQVQFRAGARVLRLEGEAAVSRDETILVGDTIQYNDSTKIVDAFGDTLVLRDPSQGDDVVARGSIRYDLTRRMGTATA
ncbi:MAG TPA: hypothetical protein VFG84_10605, partial [Gemmatimonadaceae bacterium]|nr:hypothetical protein [Gemmatimonadaceae bacterium]